MLNGLVTAIRTLTMLPVPGRDADRPSASLPWFPVIGCGLGAAVWGITLLLGIAVPGNWPEGAAALAVVAGVVLTRALHVDGLADWADAVGCMGDREKKLAVMKDPRVGAFGVSAIALSLGFKWVAVTRLVETDMAMWIVAAYVASRYVQVELAAAYSYARAEGGTAGAFVDGAGWLHRLAALAVALAVTMGMFGPAGALVVLVGFVVARLFGVWCNRSFGGVTGDLLGAASECVEILLLFGLAVCGDRILLLADWDHVLGHFR